MDSFRFHSWVWLLLIPVVVLLARWRFARRRQPAVVYSSVADLKGLPVTLVQRVRRLLPALYGIGLCLIIVAAPGSDLNRVNRNRGLPAKGSRSNWCWIFPGPWRRSISN